MNEDFFSGVEQVKCRFDGGGGALPIFYREARSFTAMLAANPLKLKRLLPDPRYQPAQVFPGVGVVTLTAFEYSDTDIGPYNEFSVGIVTNSPCYAPYPAYNLTRQYLDRFYYVFVHRLPVTTEIALRAGVDFYNFPKFVTDIVFSDSPGRLTCELGTGTENILTLDGAKLPARELGEMKFICRLYQYRQPQQAEFKLNVLQGAIDWGPRNVSVELNRSNPIGREISEAILSPRALMYLYLPAIQGILYGPENYSLPLLRRALSASDSGKGGPAKKASGGKTGSKRKTAKKKTTGKKKATGRRDTSS